MKEPWLLGGVIDGDAEAVAECVEQGDARSEEPGLAFRHELARLAIEEGIPFERRVALHRRVLDALVEAERTGAQAAAWRTTPRRRATAARSWPTRRPPPAGRAARRAPGGAPAVRTRPDQRLETLGEMHVRRNCYIGVAPVPNGLTNVCLVRPSGPA